MAAAFPFTVSTTGRLLFLSCFMKSPERRRKVVSDWMSFVMSSMSPLLTKHLFRCYKGTTFPRKRKDSPLTHFDECPQWGRAKSTTALTRRHGNHSPFFESEEASPPLDAVHSEACEPNEKR